MVTWPGALAGPCSTTSCPASDTAQDHGVSNNMPASSFGSEGRLFTAACWPTSIVAKTSAGLSRAVDVHAASGPHIADGQDLALWDSNR
ncbi:hypothetical protein WJX72_003417 [[Myrmecia] bisecta]|uniref:Uncharacterized protein n=1 Tax=[Myrmecia] bisecta TaxID=41462 RepID=A0AAW1PGJ7_9CHLO